MAQGRRRRLLARAVATAGATLGLLAAGLTGSSQATAATDPAARPAAAVQGPDRCPKGDFCLFTGANGTGHMYTYRSSVANTGWAGQHAASWANRTRFYSCVFEATDYRWAPPPHNDGYWWTGPASGAGYGWGTAAYGTAQYRDHMLSVNLAPSAHECWTTHQYVDWFPALTGPDTAPHTFGALVTGGPADLLMRSMEGRLWLLDGRGGHRDLGGGWGAMTALLRHGDFSGDGNEDVIARDGSGRLWLYPGDGWGGLGSRRLMGTGWNGMTAIVGAGDLAGDGHNDIAARDGHGRLWLYEGNGHGGLGSRRLIGTGWNGMTAIVGAGDLTSDGRPDVLARDGRGNLWLYPANGHGGLGARHLGARNVDQSWQLAAIGDVTGFGHNGLYAFGNGWLHTYAGNGKGGLQLADPDRWGTYLANESGEFYF